MGRLHNHFYINCKLCHPIKTTGIANSILIGAFEFHVLGREDL